MAAIALVESRSMLARLLRLLGYVAYAGAVLLVFIAAGEEHRFVDITEDLALVVVFGPPEGDLR